MSVILPLYLFPSDTSVNQTQNKFPPLHSGGPLHPPHHPLPVIVAHGHRFQPSQDKSAQQAGADNFSISEQKAA